jgi:organic hydroperoxide reductase OsmC/OhrA
MTNRPDSSNPHRYDARLVWNSKLGDDMSTYAGYSRAFTVHIDGRPALHGSADAMFRGEPSRHNPEDLLLAAISACHMLSYLALCARRGLRVVAYEDTACATLVLDAEGGGQFHDATLAPVVTLAQGADADAARQLHDVAHERCFIANSCNFPIHVRATVRAGGGAGTRRDP